MSVALPFDGVLCPVLVANVPKYKFKQVVVTSHTHFWKPRDIYGIDRGLLFGVAKLVKLYQPIYG